MYDNALTTKADKSNTYLKTAIATTFTTSNLLIHRKADTSNNYLNTEIDTKLTTYNLLINEK